MKRLILKTYKVFPLASRALLYLIWRINLGRNVSFGKNVSIGREVSVGRRTVIGHDAFIPEGISIGAECEIAPSSHVAFSLPNRAVVQGSPCTIIRLKGYSSAKPSQAKFAVEGLRYLLDNFDFRTVLDVGSGGGWHANEMAACGKDVTCLDFGTSVYFRESKPYRYIKADFLKYSGDELYDCIWASHVLEHQKNPNQFLRKVFSLLPIGGILAVTVPPMKPEIVGGHLTLWNAGLLLYQLVHAGFNCENAAVKSYKYNITVILKKDPIDLNSIDLDHDFGDIASLEKYFPCAVEHGFDGNIPQLNW